MNYKETLNLPKTEFSMRAVEGREEQQAFIWSSGKYELAQTLFDGPSYEIHDGPPFANGDLHMGHVLNKVLKDVDMRYHRLLGDKVTYRPGWDCHGLPIENKVKEDLREKGKKIEHLKNQCSLEALHWLDIQRDQFKRFGILGDWDHPYATLDWEYEQKVIEVFNKLKEKGLIYKERRPVPWSVEYRTALAMGELEYKTIKQNSVYVSMWSTDLQAHILIWTTTPWTLPANRAVAINPSINYAEVQVDEGEETEDYFIVAESLVEKIFGDNPNHVVIRKYTGNEILQRQPEYRRPFGGDGMIVAADYVSDKTGTGLVHIAPAHGMDDYYVGLKYGLDMFCPIKTDCTFSEEVPKLAGMNVWFAEDRIFEHLQQNNLLFAVEEIEHEYPHDWRSGKPTITIATEQTFVALDKHIPGRLTLRQEAINALDDVKFYPENGKAKLVKLIKERPDWCISRQRVWGITIPDEKDIFDVWFESGSSWTQLENYPADTYLEGVDQYRGWFQHSLLLGVAINGAAPFKKVVSHGFIVDSNGKKVSKKDKDYVPAKETVAKLGADVIRLWICSNDFHKDVCASPKMLAAFKEKYDKIRNTFKYFISNLYDYTEADYQSVEPESLDGWMRDKLSTVRKSVLEAYSNYEYHKAFQLLFNFCTNEVSSIYANAMKDRLYCDEPDSKRRRTAQSTMADLKVTLSELFEPMIPFLIDEIEICDDFGSKREQVVPSHTWPILMSLRLEALAHLDVLKKRYGLNKAVDAKVVYRLTPDFVELFTRYGEDLADIVGCGSYAIETVNDECSVYVTDVREEYKSCARSWKRRVDVGFNDSDLSERDWKAVNVYMQKTPKVQSNTEATSQVS